MTLLSPTDIHGAVEWLGLVPGTDERIESEPADRLTLDWGGPVGDIHHGLTRKACVRVRRQYDVGTEIRNTRQVSILSAEEMAEIAAGLEIPRIEPEWVGATMILSGIPDLTLLPPASRLIFEGGATLTVDTENGPCRHPAEVIESHHPGRGRAFPRIAQHKRGVTAWVERPGTVQIGERARLHVPPRRLYPHA